MSTASKRTHELFVAATLSDDDLGYPNGVEFAPDEEAWTDEVVWRNLLDGRPTLLVGPNSELLLGPRRRGVLDRLRKRVIARVAFRVSLLSLRGGRPATGLETAQSSHIESAPGVIRTRDLPLRRRTLYPLSYGRNGAQGGATGL
jgi:hypothetical protein